MKIINQTVFILIAMFICRSVFCQTNLQFIGVVQTDEQAISLTWTSLNGEVYAIQCANALATNADGSTAWQTLYDNYPSQGTNTFWLDTGNYNLVPKILHPKYMPMRFYRIVDEGPDTTSDEPSVSITLPTNYTVVSGELTVTVIAETDQPVLSGTKLYVDGQEMQMWDSETNYTVGTTNYEQDTYSINTCEWGNGNHTLFATTSCQSGYGDAPNSSPVYFGHGVSSFVQVTFSNLITRISFSQPAFDPSSGQVQEVTAIFAANSDWTLTIMDINSNSVRSVTGSGNSMEFDWDGTGNGGTNLPTGIYFYYISAQTNGGSSDDPAFGSFSSFANLSSDNASVIEIPYPPLPPGMTNDGEQQTMTIAIPASTPVKAHPGATSPGLSFQANASNAALSVPYVQYGPPAPVRPPINPIKGIAGTFGVAYDTYSANGLSGFTVGPLDNGLHIHQYIAMQKFPSDQSLTYLPLSEYKAEANNFISEMEHLGWNNTFLEVDDKLSINDLIGSGTPFNNVNLGVLMTHGTYGSSIDFEANECKQMYFPITSGVGAQYLRMSEMNLGGSGTNGLKWFAIAACNSLYHANWNNMQNAGIMPYNSNLHLLLGTDSTNYTSDYILALWSKYMILGTTNYNPLTIQAAWYQSAKDAYRYVPFTSSAPIIYAVAGDSACADDKLQTNFTPSGSWFYNSQQVYP